MSSNWRRSAYLFVLTFGLLSDAATLQSGYNNKASACCSTLQDKLPGKVFAPGSSNFQTELSTYYSAQESALISACRVSPSSAQDVSDAVAILTQKGCKFAVRSGGHMVWSGAANIAQNGITIDMLDMNSVTVSEDKTVVHVEPGTLLGKVYDTLDPLGLNVVSGRSITVGTGGFMIGGACGISNMSPRHGFANNNIVGYQVVLSNGTIVETTSVDYPDLFFALHAASTNFGVVTRYDLVAFPFTEYWGGLRQFNVSQASALVNGTLTYMDKLQSDPSGFTTLTLGYNGTVGTDFAFQNFAYLAADGSNAAIFSDLLSLPFNSSLNTLRGNIHQQSLYAEIDAAFGVGQRTLFSTFTFKADPQFPLDFFAHAQKAFAPFANTTIFWAINFQPLPIPVLNKAPSNLNPQGLTAKNGNLFLVNLMTYWTDESFDERITTILEDTIAWGIQTAKSRNLLDPWLYLNYALPTQSPYDSYGAENVQKLKVIKKKYDLSNNFGQFWSGGFKLR